MKKLLFAGVVTIAALNTYAQGTVNFANVGAGLANLFITNSATGARAAAGGGTMAQLYYANGTVTDEGALVAVTNPPVALSAAGIITGGERYLELISPSGGVGTFQVRAWASVLGGDFQAALADWLSGPRTETRVLGRSSLFTVDTADPTVVPRPTPANLVGLRPFTIDPVPEPGSIALGILGGLGALVLFRRRK